MLGLLIQHIHLLFTADGNVSIDEFLTQWGILTLAATGSGTGNPGSTMPPQASTSK